MIKNIRIITPSSNVIDDIENEKNFDISLQIKNAIDILEKLGLTVSK
jgi:hypothetical protein